jgi:hypothetical protein
MARSTERDEPRWIALRSNVAPIDGHGAARWWPVARYAAAWLLGAGALDVATLIVLRR